MTEAKSSLDVLCDWAEEYMELFTDPPDLDGHVESVKKHIASFGENSYRFAVLILAARDLHEEHKKQS